MESTKLLNDIWLKLSALAKEDELAQDIAQEEVVEEQVVAPEQEEVAVEEPVESTELSEDVTEEVAEEATEEVELEEEAPEALEEEEVELMEGYVKDEEFKSAMAGMKAEIEALKKMVDEEMGGYKKEKEMMAAEIEKLSAEPAAEPIKHSPDAEQAEKKMFTYGTNRSKSTFDRVMERIGNK
jgi:translation elongation factor EF-G